jgi:FHA domain-containing protein
LIIIEVISVNGQPPSSPLAAEVDELGGNIGRADGNTLVLPDPDKMISRRHASIAFRGGRYLICDHGTAMPLYVNGRALGNGQESPIDAGDEIRIGGFTLVVKPGARAAPPASAAERSAARPGPAPGGESRDDPLQMLGGGSRSAGVFDDLIAPAPKARPAAAKPPAPEPGAGMAIPPDYDLFETPPAPAQPGAAGPVIPDDFDLLRGTLSGAPSIDKLFDLQPGARVDPFAPDHPLGAGSPSAKTPPAQRDDAPEIRGSFRLPEAKLGPAAAAQAREQAPPEPGTSNMIVSWEGVGSPGKVKTVVIPSRAAPSQGESAPRARDPFGNEWTDPPSAAPRGAAPPPGERATPPRSGPSDQELLRAFLAGAGVPELQLPALSPKLMEIFGQLLREATKGTLDLLAARAITKREMRADMTMIVASENNPLKFSPNAEAAMSHLLAPQGRGFMTPLRAMRDAYDDLRAHQFAFVAGMRAALTGVLARFDPETLERRLTEKSVIDSVLPMNRKAKLWNLFEQLHSDLQREAEDDFDALFGREFLRAYEAQLAKLEQAGKDPTG